MLNILGLCIVITMCTARSIERDDCLYDKWEYNLKESR